MQLHITYYESISKEQLRVGAVGKGAKHIPGVDKFLLNFVQHYRSSDEFRGSLLTSLMKAYMCKIQGNKNPEYGGKVKFC